MIPIVSPEAIGDIEEIIDHLTEDNPAAADRLVAKIEDAIGLLAETPGAGHFRHDLTPHDVRFWRVARVYLIVYRERPETIEVIRVLHGNRDVASILK